MTVAVGDRAPDFALPAAGGATVRLSDYQGRRAVVLYFYPKDETLGCTAEACAFRDSYRVFADAGAEVIGVSGDSVASHQRFADRHQLPFILVSDSDGAVSRRYGARKLFGLLGGRVTFVIDREGMVRHVFDSQLAFTRHVREALEAIRSAPPPRQQPRG